MTDEDEAFAARFGRLADRDHRVGSVIAAVLAFLALCVLIGH